MPPDGAGLPTGAFALKAAVVLLDDFRAAQAAVDRAQWQVTSNFVRVNSFGARERESARLALFSTATS